MDRESAAWLLLLLGIVALIGFICVKVAEEDNRKQVTFMEACAADGRKLYDCELQWQTYQAARSAETQAASAMGLAASARR